MGRLTVNVDGGARGNPGPAAIGVRRAQRRRRGGGGGGERIGKATNNVAEYRALLLGIERAAALGASELELVGDSELVVRQVEGRVQSQGRDVARAARRGEASPGAASTAGRSATSAASTTPTPTASSTRLDGDAAGAVAARPSRSTPASTSATSTSRWPTSTVPSTSTAACSASSCMQRYGDDAAFVSAGGYHHHIGLNSWQSKGGSPPPPGTTGLFHVAIRYPTRRALADALRRLTEAGVPLGGASDHGVSEALYLADPDGNGIELYWDRPKEEWPEPQEGQKVEMYVRPLDLDDLLAELG